MRKKVTIYDLSKAAGVSACCVSWVLRNHPRSREVGTETRERILQIARELGYHRNQLASATRTGNVDTIAVILDPEYYGKAITFIQIVAGIMLEATTFRQSIKIFPDDELEGSFQSIAENQIDKVVMVSVDYEKRERAAELAQQYSISLVFAYEHGHRGFPAVNVDNVEMTSKMVDYLAKQGHVRIGLLCVPHKCHYIADRHAGYLLGMKRRALKTDKRWVFCSDDVEHSLDRLMGLPQAERPTALVTLSDRMAARVQAYAIRNGLDFPQDLSVVGIGDTDIARQQPFPLTTMSESLVETGHLLVRLLMNGTLPLEHDEYNVYHTHAEIIERESVCQLKASKSRKNIPRRQA